jgi:hypothetical protein
MAIYRSHRWPRCARPSICVLFPSSMCEGSPRLPLSVELRWKMKREFLPLPFAVWLFLGQLLVSANPNLLLWKTLGNNGGCGWASQGWWRSQIMFKTLSTAQHVTHTHFVFSLPSARRTHQEASACSNLCAGIAPNPKPCLLSWTPLQLPLNTLNPSISLSLSLSLCPGKVLYNWAIFLALTCLIL